MSIQVPMDDLRAAVAERGFSAYLLTVSEDGSPHAVHASLGWDEGTLVAEAGNRTAANASARPSVSLLFPLRSDGDYSLIVDGVASVATDASGRRLRVTPTRAVLHRPAAATDPASACGADCVPILPKSPASRGRS